MTRTLFFIWSFAIALILIVLTSLLLEFGWATRISIFYFSSLLGVLLAEIVMGDRAGVIRWGSNLSEIWYFYIGLFYNYTIPGIVLFLSKQTTNSLYGQILIFSVLAINGLAICLVLYKKSRSVPSQEAP